MRILYDQITEDDEKDEYGGGIGRSLMLTLAEVQPHTTEWFNMYS